MTAGTTAVDRRWQARSIVRTMIPLLVVLTTIELGSGIVLTSLEQAYLHNPSLLVLVPAMIDLGGNLGSILSARLSTQLHLGTIEFDAGHPDETIVSNALATLGLAILVSFVLGIFAYVVGVVFGSGTLSLLTVVSISVISATILALLVITASITATWFSFRFGVDPDDTAIPIVTNVSDVAGVLILSGVILAVL